MAQITEKIKLWGIVQGVGFRPFAAKLADRFGMKGEIRNIGGLVEIFVTDTPNRISEFIEAVKNEKPEPAEIVHIKREEIPYRDYSEFTICASGAGDEEAAMIPADLAVCPDCLSEMRDINNPRYNHPMISCMVCGPRYTITDKFPYDRENTSMTDFPMCEFCEKEYTDRSDRRYHAQTISCHDCGPYLKFRWGSAGTGECGCRYSDLTARTDGRDVIGLAASLLKEGKVLAYKSMGGYNLMADPLNDWAVADLREIKKREAKPFAVMFKSVEQIREYCEMNEVEERLISSSARPILLLERLESVKSKEFQRSRFIGSFLPSMGAQYQLLEAFGGPLIATSANPASLPIIKEDEEMFAMMEREPLIAGVMYNDRKIRVSVDDSVVRVIDGQPQIIRRSKGYAPVPLYIESGAEKGAGRESLQILAAGGQLKNSFALSKGPFSYVSQYFGDMDSLESRKIYEDNVERMRQLFRIEPKKVVCDMHPLYYTTSFAEKYAKLHNIPITKIQHHHAHVASVMAEHDIEGPVIGVSFDGTGYGTDGNIWGGEFLLCEGAGFERASHLAYVEMPGGDESMKDACRSAIAYICAHENSAADEGEDDFRIDISDIIKYYENSNVSIADNQTETLIRSAIKAKINTIKSSSMGRLFDAVSALLGICSYNSYEGECAIKLEDAATRALRGKPVSEADELALKFHEQVSQTILRKCNEIRNRTGCSKAALTGGVFQNKIITERALEFLREAEFEVYYNISVSPNDGGIALGQTFIAMQEE